MTREPLVRRPRQPRPAREPEPLTDPERRAAWLAAKHAGTPRRMHLDSLGRPIYAVADYGGGNTAAVRSESDLTGRSLGCSTSERRQVADGFAGMAGRPVTSRAPRRAAAATFVRTSWARWCSTWDELGRHVPRRL